jgi:predicted nuclease with TOPRIM domain
MQTKENQHPLSDIEKLKESESLAKRQVVELYKNYQLIESKLADAKKENANLKDNLIASQKSQEASILFIKKLEKENAELKQRLRESIEFNTTIIDEKCSLESKLEQSNIKAVDALLKLNEETLKVIDLQSQLSSKDEQLKEMVEALKVAVIEIEDNLSGWFNLKNEDLIKEVISKYTNQQSGIQNS